MYAIKTSVNYRCHNCGASMTFNSFLKKVDSTLQSQYSLEKFKDGKTGKGSTTNEPNVVQDYENLNSAFNCESPNHEVNENLVFNTELLNRCRQECKHKIDVQVLAYGGKMVTDVLELIDIRTVHPAGKEITNNKTGTVLPKGFQILSLIHISEPTRPY